MAGEGNVPPGYRGCRKFSAGSSKISRDPVPEIGLERFRLKIHGSNERKGRNRRVGYPSGWTERHPLPPKALLATAYRPSPDTCRVAVAGPPEQLWQTGLATAGN
jgi:hypothetical protein